MEVVCTCLEGCFPWLPRGRRGRDIAGPGLWQQDQSDEGKYKAEDGQEEYACRAVKIVDAATSTSEQKLWQRLAGARRTE